MRRIWTWIWLLCCVAGVLLSLGGTGVRAQEADGLAAVAAIEQALVEAIARAEQSVVSIARIKRTAPQAGLNDLPGPFKIPRGEFAHLRFASSTRPGMTRANHPAPCSAGKSPPR